MTINARKAVIINKIKHVQENWLLRSIEKLLSDIDEVKEEHEKSSVVDYTYYVGNIEEKVDLEKIKRERPLKKLDMAEFEQLADELEWEQSIDELLEDLK